MVAAPDQRARGGPRRRGWENAPISVDQETRGARSRLFPACGDHLIVDGFVGFDGVRPATPYNSHPPMRVTRYGQKKPSKSSKPSKPSTRRLVMANNPEQNALNSRDSTASVATRSEI